ncbi:hypothetical protein ACH43Z_24745 [Streptomyces sp. NPDC020406]|uniref:hypothetical protein n=1 Tax=Streptomyces sp. NPDC020406 TaxID=3365072 RepID=UPI0037B3A826
MTATAEDRPAYTPASGARRIQGAESGVDSPFIEKAAVYTDTIGPGEKKYYRVRLDDSSNAFVSTVVAPPPGTEIGFTDGVRLSLTSTDGSKCGTDVSLTFGGESTRPVAGAASRRRERDRNCQEAGEYLYTVEWSGPSGKGAEKAAEPWPIELTYMAEPGLKPGADVPRAPTGWSSEAPPAPSTMTRKETAGGTGFNDAAAVREGVWQDDIRPGESRFYRVPVAWGQQLSLRAQVAGSGTGSSFFAANGLRLELYNPARARVADQAVGYTGKPTGVEFGTAPAAYANRFVAETEAARAMSFQGWYYVQVTLGDRARETVPLRMDVDLRGTAQSGPPYEGDPEAAGFGLGDPADATKGNPGMRILGIAGIGTGTALVLGLGAWSYAARRRPAGAVHSR